MTTLLLLAADLLTGTLARASVRVRTLAANGQTATMAKAAVAADLHQTLHVLGNLTMEVALDGEVVLDVVTQLRELFLGEIVGAGVRVDAGFREDLFGGREADAVDIGQTDLDALVAREVDTNKTSHIPFSLP